MSDDKELDAALRALETKHRTEDYLKKLGASDEAAALIASSPEYAKKFSYDGVNLTFNGSDLAAVDDPAAKAFFHEGPFKSLFGVGAEKPGADSHQQIDPTILASARAGNLTAKGRLLRSLNGDVEALNAVLADEGNGNGDDAAGAGGGGGAGAHKNNPFTRLRDRNGKIVPEVERQIEGMIRAMGTARVSAIAKAANMTITGLPLTR
jgi:hypothetical protein